MVIETALFPQLCAGASFCNATIDQYDDLVNPWFNRNGNVVSHQQGKTTGGTQCHHALEKSPFYDALEVNDSAVQVLGDKTLRIIAQELVKAVHNSVKIDWTLRENVRAQMRVMIKRILRRYGYPPDKQARATELVLEQAAVLCRDQAEDSL